MLPTREMIYLCVLIRMKYSHNNILYTDAVNYYVVCHTLLINYINIIPRTFDNICWCRRVNATH